MASMNSEDFNTDSAGFSSILSPLCVWACLPNTLKNEIVHANCVFGDGQLSQMNYARDIVERYN
jgi:hypothetical protein